MAIVACTFAVGAYGLANTTLIISSQDAFPYYNAMGDISSQVQSNSSIILTDRQSLYSKPLDGENNINFIEGTFRIKELLEKNGHAGIEWNQGNEYYYVFPRNNTLVLWASATLSEVAHAPITVHNGEWYKLNIIDADNMTNIYLNGTLMLQMPQRSEESVLKVGIRTYDAIAEFSSVQVSSEIIRPVTNSSDVEYNLLDFASSDLGTYP